MAVNPITSDDLTIDLKSLLRLSVSDRVTAAANDTGFAQALMQSLTPIQLAKAFPDYYRRELPDISNFILANRYLDKVGAGGFDQRGGGTYGTQQTMYGGEAVPDKTVPRLPGQQSEVKKSKVQQILDKAGITGTVGVTSAIKEPTGRVVSTADVSLSPSERALLDTIAIGNPNEKGAWESLGYNKKVFGGEFESFADHPRQAKIRGSNAAGRYQFLESTWDDTVARYNKQNPDNPITDFSPVNQDRAALWLAAEGYKRRTGRNLKDDLENPPENFGDLLKIGLGGGTYAGLEPGNTTWQAFQKRRSDEIGNAFEANLARNQGYREQEIKAEAEKKERIDKQITATPELMEQFKGDETVQKYFADNPEMADKVQEAITAGRMSVDDVSSIVQKKKIDSAITASLDGVISSPNFIDQGGGVRNLPIPQDIKEKMIYAQERAGIAKVVSISSGQIPWEEAEAMGAVIDRNKNWVLPDGRIVGKGAKHRHGIDVGAGDLQFYDEKGNILKIYDPRVLNYMKYAAAAGLTGIGAGEGYMGSDTVHVGAGETGSWGGEDAIIDQQIAAGIAIGPDDHNKWKEQKIAEQKKSTVAETETTATAKPASNKTMLISMATNDWGNEDLDPTYNNGVEAIKQARAKGYEPVLILPASTGKTQKVHEVMSRVATELGVTTEQPQEYDEDGYHPTIKESKKLAALHPGSVAVGDSIAHRIGTYIKDGQTIATDSIQSGKVLEKITSEQVPSLSTETKVPAYQFGGTPTLQDDEDLTAVGSDGKPRFKFNSGEGLYVKPEANEYADDKIDELSNRIDKMAENQQKPEVKAMPDTRSPKSDPRWAEKVASAYRPSGTQQRAFNRAQFRSEGRHVGDRGSPNIA